MYKYPQGVSCEGWVKFHLHPNTDVENGEFTFIANTMGDKLPYNFAARFQQYMSFYACEIIKIATAKFPQCQHDVQV